MRLETDIANMFADYQPVGLTTAGFSFPALSKARTIQMRNASGRI